METNGVVKLRKRKSKRSFCFKRFHLLFYLIFFHEIVFVENPLQILNIRFYHKNLNKTDFFNYSIFSLLTHTAGCINTTWPESFNSLMGKAPLNSKNCIIVAPNSILYCFYSGPTNPLTGISKAQPQIRACHSSLHITENPFSAKPANSRDFYCLYAN